MKKSLLLIASVISCSAVLAQTTSVSLGASSGVIEKTDLISNKASVNASVSGSQDLKSLSVAGYNASLVGGVKFSSVDKSLYTKSSVGLKYKKDVDVTVGFENTALLDKNLKDLGNSTDFVVTVGKDFDKSRVSTSVYKSLSNSETYSLTSYEYQFMKDWKASAGLGVKHYDGSVNRFDGAIVGVSYSPWSNTTISATVAGAGKNVDKSSKDTVSSIGVVYKF